MSGFLDNIVNVTESYILMTEDEKKNLIANNSGQPDVVTLQKFLTIYKLEDIPSELQYNMQFTFKKAQAFEAAYIAAGGCPLDWTSVFRSKEHHIRIYKEIAARKKVSFDLSKVPMGSKHLKFLAWDCKPKNNTVKHLQDWVLHEEHGIMASLDLFFEGFDFTTGWVHAQTAAFGSYKDGGTRFFTPY